MLGSFAEKEGSFDAPLTLLYPFFFMEMHSSFLFAEKLDSFPEIRRVRSLFSSLLFCFLLRRQGVLFSFAEIQGLFLFAGMEGFFCVLKARHPLRARPLPNEPNLSAN